jgi:hypothetical protein
VARINEGNQVYDLVLQILINHKLSNTCDSLVTNERDHLVRNDYLHQRTLQCFIWILKKHVDISKIMVLQLKTYKSWT